HDQEIMDFPGYFSSNPQELNHFIRNSRNVFLFSLPNSCWLVSQQSGIQAACYGNNIEILQKYLTFSQPRIVLPQLEKSICKLFNILYSDLLLNLINYLLDCPTKYPLCFQENKKLLNKYEYLLEKIYIYSITSGDTSLSVPLFPHVNPK